MRAAMETSKTRTIRTAMCLIQKPTIGKTALSFLMLTALTLFIGCSTTQTPDEPKWNDMYEVRTYEVKTETYTNEIITTVFICRQTETNKVIATQKEVEDFGGYEFEPIVEAEEPVVKQNLTTPEFQCVDGSCGIKE